MLSRQSNFLSRLPHSPCGETCMMGPFTFVVTTRYHLIMLQDPTPTPCLKLRIFLPHSLEESFSKMDLTTGYLQIPLDEQSKEYTTMNTHS